ncbi:MAG: DUF2065 domain-containing protein, partial [Betaproteobacteria bacterium]|nr:DUF2065 domain-containing protein [Betaproteobacteria bacterium]
AAMMLILEGLMPFLAPRAWREAFRRILAFTDGQLRFAGLISMMAGLALLGLAVK